MALESIATISTPSTVPVGTKIAVDQLAGGEAVQMVKLVDGSPNSETPITGDATNGLDVDVTRLPALPAGTNNIGDVDVLTLPALPTGSNVIGSVNVPTTQAAIPLWGHGSTNSGVPTSATLAGVNARSTLPAPTVDGSMKPALADLTGRLVTVPFAPRELIDDANITLTTTAETTLIAQTVSEYHDLIAVVCSNASTSVETRVDFRDATAGTIRFSLFVPAKATVGFNLPTPKRQAVVNTNWTAQCGTGGADVRIFAQFVRNR